MKTNLKFIVFVLIASLSFSCSAQKTQRYYHLLIGTYTKTQNKGIFVYKFDSKNGLFTLESNTENIKNPSFLVLNNKKDKVYSVSEGASGQVSAFDFDNHTGKLTLINSQETQSPGPCYVNLTKDNKFLLSANYSGGSVSVFPVNNDGSIAPLTQLIQHEGSSIDPKGRQKTAHAHSVTNSPDGSHLYVADLGTDKIFGYKYNATSAKPLQPASQAFVSTIPASGPRHFVFNNKGDKVYCAEELSGTVRVYNYENEEFKPVQRLNMFTSDFKGENGAADIHLSNDGKFLYATNRGTANQIAIYKVDENTGKLTFIAAQDCGGKHPRNFAIDPTDKFVLIANRDTDDVIVFLRDQKSGLLKNTNQSLKIGAPVCLKFTPIK